MEFTIHVFKRSSFPCDFAGPNEKYTHEAEKAVGMFWRLFAQPVLFGIIGTLIDFRTIETGEIPKSVLLILIGKHSRSDRLADVRITCTSF